MIVCPWCGTNYETFRSNCKNCGGPIPGTATRPVVEDDALLPPPGAPRTIADRYVLRLMTVEGLSIAGFVLALVGGIFLLVGAALTLGIVTAFVGIPFALLGVFLLLFGGALLFWRYQQNQKVVNVLRWGQAVRGQVTQVEENFAVRINNRHPWVIQYQFRLNGQTYGGKVTTLNRPGEQLQPGQPTYVLYHPDSPDLNAIYPHP